VIASGRVALDDDMSGAIESFLQLLMVNPFPFHWNISKHFFAFTSNYEF
jgi:hypothetical protein